MTEVLIDILTYLFDKAVALPSNKAGQLDPERVIKPMLQAGFHPDSVEFTVNWLKDINKLQHGREKISAPHQQSFRIFSADECAVIHSEARAYITYLQQAGIIDAQGREMIIDQAMSFDESGVSLNLVKWISMMLLLNKPEREDKIMQMGEQVFTQDQTKH